MGKKKKEASRSRGMQAITLCISTTMVLILLGLMVLAGLTANNLSRWVKENLTVTVMLNDTVSVNDAKRLCRNLYHRPYSKNIDYISKEQALLEQTQAMGADPSEFLGENPFVATLELQLYSEYANRDSLLWIAREVKADRRVTDVAYQEDLMDKVNQNLRKMGVVLLVLAVLLSIVCYSLISNSVRLSVYSQRFLIHTKKLVGASWSFIRRPFMLQFIGIGIVAAILACAVLGAAVVAAYSYQPGLDALITWVELLVTGLSVLLFGVLITAVCTYVSVGRFLKMTAGELYKI